MKEPWQTMALAYRANGHSVRACARGVGKPETTVREFFKRHDNPQGKIITFDEMIEKLKADLDKSRDTHDNSRILFISDMHIPYHHKNLLPFLKGLKQKYNPTRIIGLGDEVDYHALSFHDSDPDLDSAGPELEKAKLVIADIKELFPVMDIVESNHGSLAYRRAKAHGMPRALMKSYNEVLGVDSDWTWHEDIVIDLPDGQYVYVHHGKTNKAIRTAQLMGMSHVSGHYHEAFGIEYWSNPHGLYFGMNSGCLIDKQSMAFAYNRINPKRPIIGTSLIIDGKPVLEAMPL